MNMAVDKNALSGWLNGLLGVVIFSGSLPATLLHERVSPLMMVITLGVILCVIGSRKYAR